MKNLEISAIIFQTAITSISKQRSIQDFAQDAIEEIMMCSVEKNSIDNLSIVILLFSNFADRYQDSELAYFEAGMRNANGHEKDSNCYNAAKAYHYNDLRKLKSFTIKSSIKKKEEDEETCECFCFFRKKKKSSSRANIGK